jgi:hypothetical protein
MPIFLFILHIFYNIHTFLQSQYIYPSPFAEASLHFPIAQRETPPCGAERRIVLRTVCHGSCFLSYTAESSHHPMVAESSVSGTGLPYSKRRRYQLSHATLILFPTFSFHAYFHSPPSPIELIFNSQHSPNMLIFIM